MKAITVETMIADSPSKTRALLTPTASTLSRTANAFPKDMVTALIERDMGSPIPPRRLHIGLCQTGRSERNE
jgi:hypothetical protein